MASKDPRFLELKSQLRQACQVKDSATIQGTLVELDEAIQIATQSTTHSNTRSDTRSDTQLVTAPITGLATQTASPHETQESISQTAVPIAESHLTEQAVKPVSEPIATPPTSTYEHRLATFDATWPTDSYELPPPAILAAAGFCQKSTSHIAVCNECNINVPIGTLAIHLEYMNKSRRILSMLFNPDDQTLRPPRGTPYGRTLPMIVSTPTCGMLVGDASVLVRAIWIHLLRLVAF